MFIVESSYVDYSENVRDSYFLKAFDELGKASLFIVSKEDAGLDMIPWQDEYGDVKTMDVGKISYELYAINDETKILLYENKGDIR
jgi:hypothetical protein